MTPLRLGTRASPLAIIQANLVRDLLATSAPEITVELVEITSSRGDLDKTSSLTEGRGWFTSTIQDALLANTIDVAVHSYKDLPTAQVPGLEIAAVPVRADPRDVVVSRGPDLEGLASGAKVGTSSPRREAQLRRLRPDLDIQPIRGNVGTRISKVDSGEYDATVLALAGIDRLGIPERANQVFTTDEMLPAPAQGALAVECRLDDGATIAALAGIDHEGVRATVTAERAFLARLEAGCSFPAAAFATLQGGRLTLTALVADSAEPERASVDGLADAPIALGQHAADQLLRWLER